MNNITSQRKHDLVEETPFHTPQTTNNKNNSNGDTDQPLVKRKRRTISLKRPSSHPPSPTTTSPVSTTTTTIISADTTQQQHAAKPTPTTATVEQSLTDSVRSSSSRSLRSSSRHLHLLIPQQDSAAAWSKSDSERESTNNSILSIPDCDSQKERALQETSTTTTTTTTTPPSKATATTTTTVTAAQSIVQLQCVASEEKEDLDDFETPFVLPTTTTSPNPKAIHHIKAPPTANELAVQGAGGSAAIVVDELIIDATNINNDSNLPEDLMHDPDCNEDPINNDDFELDEIQDWDDFEDINSATPIDPVPENACPTPDAHVNRCLDGSLAEQEQHAPTTSTTTTSAVVASEPLTSRNPLANIIGTIRTVISNFPSYPPQQPQQPQQQPSSNGGGSSSTSKHEGSSKQLNGKKAGGNFKPKAPRPCPFYKKMPDTGFTVDAFCYGKVEGCDAYFLSHFHSDHYGGLTSTWNHGPIYCSSITANLVITRLKVDEQYVKRLPMYEPTVVDGVTVRLMDANHCPGSVLFVFDLHNPKRRYLHTGDFRASPDMIIDPILRQPQNVPIDILYLDTTYSNPRYTFPPQDVVIRETARLICHEVGIQTNNQPAAAVAAVPIVKVIKRVNLMESWLKKETGNSEKLLSMSIKSSQIVKSKQAWKEPAEKNRIVICVGTYLIGKERVFKAIAKAINSKVYVQPHKLEIFKCLEDPELMAMLTSDRHEAQVHLLHMGSDMSPEALQDYLDSLAPTFVRLIAVRPTGWTFTGNKKFTPANDNGPSSTDMPARSPTSLELRPSYTSATVKIYPVPYSEHSSFSELAGFCRSLNIHKVIPTVGVGSEKGRHAMTEWFKRWEQERRQGIGWD
ncbi:DRMBL-domain-containing protein [Linnemannia elongata AG-77]|uniref:DRMBL-domain-containing protein n=1 Tax=Linnemannia elongata AG-77 TaxID=1314771 RepID=A0A197K0P8_9FUNG|nr:DRMBL-domain-containing protein [Linnemannia elongata AG-77]